MDRIIFYYKIFKDNYRTLEDNFSIINNNEELMIRNINKNKNFNFLSERCEVDMISEPKCDL